MKQLLIVALAIAAIACEKKQAPLPIFGERELT